MEIDSVDHLPLYADAEQALSARILNGPLSPRTRLPSEDCPVQEYVVSRTTIRAAVQSLIQRGLVEIQRGQGTFVSRLARRPPGARKGGSRK